MKKTTDACSWGKNSLINRAEMKTVGTVIAAIVILLILRGLDHPIETMLSPMKGNAAPLLFESLSFSICFAVFIVGWMIFTETLCRQRLMVTSLFMGIGLLDVLSTMSTSGMILYDSTTGETPSMMLNWISQWICGIGLLTVFSLRNSPVSPRVRKYALLVIILSVGLITWLVFRVESWNLILLNAIQPLQTVSVFVLYLAAMIVILYKHRVERPQAMLTIVQALIWLFIAKVEETINMQSNGGQFLLSDCLKIVGYYYLLKGIYYVLIEEPYKQRKKTEARIQYLAFHDELTGLPNRRFFSERVQGELGRVVTKTNKFAILWLDLDRFKTINDSLGHAFGDQILVTVAERLRCFNHKRENVFRLGGDEFTVLLTDLEDDRQAENDAKKLIGLIEAPMKIGSSIYHLTGSVGIAIFPEDGGTLGALLQNADTAMYSAKSTRNNWKRYTVDMNMKAKERLLLENELRIAFELDQFRLVYQPLVELENEQLIGAEALIRWDHPLKGEIPPSEFIPICEESGFILQLGEWVLRTACKQAKQWQDQGFRKIMISVNLSVRQFRQHDLCERIEKVLEETGLEPEWLELELTESMMADVTFATDVLMRLKQIGVSLSIDDFGTGYSSLSYLKKFPIDKLKIDRTFVNDVLTNQYDAAIVSGISTLANNLKLKVTAEGVETSGQVDFLREQLCQEAQGFLYSQPVPPEQFVALFHADER
ncbi:MAG: EAL domain-containing protein [Candidatus Cohnella colombiensis]|uniref:EAL domain-containing protein n=1 Tax=Candidatus Cohnella colombiensis TaxID=3121368 RepID=A0AA95JDP5_9BACL|nr:MAG: EAL domain-containing protein [Cohnella sp.]